MIITDKNCEKIKKSDTWKEILEIYQEYEARKRGKRLSFWKLIKLYL